MRSTSGRMALRVCTMRLPHCGQLFLGRAQRLLHAMRRRPARNIMAGKHTFHFQILVNVRIKRRAELAQLLGRELLQLTTLLHAFLHRMRHNLMRLAEGYAFAREISCGSHGIHESALTCRLHPLAIEYNLAHEPGCDFEAMVHSGGSVE